MSDVKMAAVSSISISRDNNIMASIAKINEDIKNEQTIYQESEIFSTGFTLFEEIRRSGKLCDVTLKVSTAN